MVKMQIEKIKLKKMQLICKIEKERTKGHRKKNLVFCRSLSLNREILKLEEKGHKPSQAENCSARALAWASSARAHHYYLVK